MNIENSSDIDWAEIIDLFASEYGWTMDYITELDLGQITKLMDKMQIRRDKQNGSSEEGTPSSNMGGDPSDTEMPMSYFENNLGGKKVVEDGVTKIII